MIKEIELRAVPCCSQPPPLGVSLRQNVKATVGFLWAACTQSTACWQRALSRFHSAEIYSSPSDYIRFALLTRAEVDSSRCRIPPRPVNSSSGLQPRRTNARWRGKMGAACLLRTFKLVVLTHDDSRCVNKQAGPEWRFVHTLRGRWPVPACRPEVNST